MDTKKHCTKCLVEKGLFEFSTSKKSKDGKHSWCRPCVNTDRILKKEKYRVAQNLYVQNNPDKVIAWQKKSRDKPSAKIKKQESDRAYQEKFADRIKVRRKKYRDENREKVLEGKRRHYQENKQAYVVRAYERAKNIKNLTPLDANKTKIQEFYNVAKLLTKQTGIKHEVDHIIPISKGGTHHQNNLQVLPWIENRIKGSKIMDKKGKA